jgi:lipoprotein-anchoring transpeptidase ErfK/SrfK
MLTRRSFAALGAVAGLSACAKPKSIPASATNFRPQPAAIPPLPTVYHAIPDERFPIPALPEGVLSPELWRTEVANPFPDRKPGTIIVDPDAAILHLIASPDRAVRYGVSVGAACFA